VLLLGVAGLIAYYHQSRKHRRCAVDGHITPVASKIYGRVAEVLADRQPTGESGSGAGEDRPAGLSGQLGSGQGPRWHWRKAMRLRREWMFRARARMWPVEPRVRVRSWLARKRTWSARR